MNPPGWERYYAIVRRIPRGRVTTYGVVARLAKQPRTARHVGWAMAALHGKKAHEIPWHRVMGVRGKGYAAISIPPANGGTTQRKRLTAEGVRFDGKGRVALESYGWNG